MKNKGYAKFWGQKRSIMGDVQMANTDSLLQIDENAHEQVTCVTILLRNASRGVRRFSQSKSTKIK